MDNPAAPILSTFPQPAVEPEVSIPSESSNSRRLLWFAGGLVMLIIGISIGIFSAKFFSQSPSLSQLPPTNWPELPPQSLTPTLIPDPTANWKIYTSSKFQYSLKYPEELDGYSIETNDSFTIGYPGPSDVNLLKIDVYKTTLSPEEWWNKNGKNIYTRFFNIAFNKIELAKIKGTEVVGQTKSPGGSTLATHLFLLSQNNILFVIEDNSKNTEFDQILSTFHFLK